MSNGMRIAVETRIAKKLVSDLVDAGFELSVAIEPTDSVDPRDNEIWRSTDKAAIGKAMMAGDEDWIKVFKPSDKKKDLPFGWVRMVYGNDGWDVISDYTTNLEPQLKAVNEFAEKLEENPFAGMVEAAS